VNINLIYVDGSINKKEQKKLISGKKTYFGPEENKNLPTINLLYNQNCFFKFYTVSEYEENINVYKRFASHIKEIIILDDCNTACELCNKNQNNTNKNNSKKIYFKSQLIYACIECIREKSDLIIDSRFSNYQKDWYLSRECN